MITNWALIPPELVLRKFDLFVAVQVEMLFRRIVDPEYARRGLELRTDVLDIQLAKIQAAIN